MGCDIHLFSENLIDGKWVSNTTSILIEEEGEDPYTELPQINCPRNYWLFGLLSKGVRTEWEWSFEPKPLPEDLSLEVQEDINTWSDDGHSHNWLTLRELKEKATELLLVDSHDAKELLGYLMELIASIPNKTEDPDATRIVFFFDN